MNKSSVIVFWFRRDLRLDDNCGLFHALKAQYPVLPVFIFDANILEPLVRDDKRVSFIYQTLIQLNEKLIESGSSLFVIHNTALLAFRTLYSLFDVKGVITNHDYEPYAIRRDKEVSDFIASQSGFFRSFKDQVIFERSEVVKGDRMPYTVFTPYSESWKQKYGKDPPKSYNSGKLHDHFFKTKPFDFPSLHKIAFKPSLFEVPAPAINKKVIGTYDKTRDFPYLDATSRLSVHLRFGTISIRNVVNLAHRLNQQWLNEFVWREFFMMILYHFPRVVTESFKRKYDNIQWRNNEKEFEAWCKGETGYPIVDAGMRQLNATGFMHNRVRMIVASFLTKHLLIDWRWGESYFAEKLLDYELSSNNGNWQWAAGCGCDAAPYFRIFNPTLQTKRFDPDLLYIKKWIADYESYKIPPVVDHKFARKRALSVYNEALKSRTQGPTPK